MTTAAPARFFHRGDSFGVGDKRLGRPHLLLNIKDDFPHNVYHDAFADEPAARLLRTDFTTRERKLLFSLPNRTAYLI
jgi:hypothetical protein